MSAVLPILQPVPIFKNKDYRDVEGTYDKVVSIGLAEHTWEKKGYDVFMRKIASLLNRWAICRISSCRVAAVRGVGSGSRPAS